jgi:hypothetical protein
MIILSMEHTISMYNIYGPCQATTMQAFKEMSINKVFNNTLSAHQGKQSPTISGTKVTRRLKHSS